MIKLNVGEFDAGMNVVRYLEQAEVQQKLNFIAKDKLLSILNYQNKIKNINSEKEKIAESFGKLLYKLKEGVVAARYQDKLYEFKDMVDYQEFSKYLKLKNSVEVEKIIANAKAVVDFTKSNIARAGDGYYKITNQKMFDKYMKVLFETEIELPEAKAFTHDDLASMSELMVGDIAALGKFYAGNSTHKEDKKGITITIDKKDLAAAKKEEKAPQ